MLENESITSFCETFDNIRKESKAFNNELLQKNKVSKDAYFKYYKSLKSEEEAYVNLPEISSRDSRGMCNEIPIIHSILKFEIDNSLIPRMPKMLKSLYSKVLSPKRNR